MVIARRLVLKLGMTLSSALLGAGSLLAQACSDDPDDSGTSGLGIGGPGGNGGKGDYGYGYGYGCGYGEDGDYGYGYGHGEGDYGYGYGYGCGEPGTFGAAPAMKAGERSELADVGGGWTAGRGARFRSG